MPCECTKGLELSFTLQHYVIFSALYSFFMFNIYHPILHIYYSKGNFLIIELKIKYLDLMNGMDFF